MVKAIIISGGNIHRDFALDFLKKELENTKREQLLLIAADRGMEFFREIKYVPDLAVGDFDSLSEDGKCYMENCLGLEIVRLKPEKDDSDTQSAMNLAISRGAKKIILLGATGTRLDHVMANFGLLAYGSEKGISVEILDAHNRISLVESGTVLKKQEKFGKYISFFPYGSDVTALTLQGFKYGLKDYTLKASDSGLTVSNEFKEDEVKITYKTGRLLMIMSQD